MPLREICLHGTFAAIDLPLRAIPGSAAAVRPISLLTVNAKSCGIVYEFKKLGAVVKVSKVSNG